MVTRTRSLGSRTHMAYAEACARMGKRDRVKLENHTYLVWATVGASRNAVAVVFHQTMVVVIQPDGTYRLNTGGYKTKTTKERLNAYSPACVNGRYSTSRTSAGEWWVTSPNDVRSVFNDGMVVDGNGDPVNPMPYTPSKRQSRTPTDPRIRSEHAFAHLRSTGRARWKSGATPAIRRRGMKDVALTDSWTMLCHAFHDCLSLMERWYLQTQTAALDYQSTVLVATTVVAKRRALAATLTYMDSILTPGWAQAAVLAHRLVNSSSADYNPRLTHY